MGCHGWRRWRGGGLAIIREGKPDDEDENEMGRLLFGINKNKQNKREGRHQVFREAGGRVIRGGVNVLIGFE